MYDPYLTPDRLREIKSGHARSNAEQMADATHESGIVMADDRAPRTPYRPRALHATPQMISQRWGYAVARINRILEGAARSASLTGAVAGAEYPELARQFGELWSYYMTRQKPPPVRGVDHNPFRHKSDRDASRMFIRMVENICDRSTGKLGSWYVR